MHANSIFRPRIIYPANYVSCYENPLRHEEFGRASKRAFMVAVELSSLLISTEQPLIANNKLNDPTELLPLNQSRKGWFGPDTR